MGRSLKQCHRARFVERSCQPLMHPGFPVVGVDLEQVLMRRPDPVHMEPFTDVLDDGTGRRRSVVPLLSLLRCAATDRRVEPLHRLAEPVHHIDHITGVD
ncbi:hypothetical protein KOR42_55680 [Thalassoglobus neptunius]|uniref:Uncharacterized protein n=1 Tax=Thalassoglobus neptunius TaxID=1938619 RepID=A0A5C5UUA0_9PLAN|nr:hypothetical protein KOR42_55680 [Thalassoglobus neptunius]